MTNRYGVDVSYFEKELKKLSESLIDRTPEELHRYLIRLAEVVSVPKYVNYYDGIIEGLSRYAWWKDGVQYVGTCGRTLKEAIADVERERNEN